MANLSLLEYLSQGASNSKTDISILKEIGSHELGMPSPSVDWVFHDIALVAMVSKLSKNLQLRKGRVSPSRELIVRDPRASRVLMAILLSPVFRPNAHAVLLLWSIRASQDTARRIFGQSYLGLSSATRSCSIRVWKIISCCIFISTQAPDAVGLPARTCSAIGYQNPFV